MFILAYQNNTYKPLQTKRKEEFIWEDKDQNRFICRKIIETQNNGMAWLGRMKNASVVIN